MAYLLGVQFQAIAYLVFAYYGAEYLNERYAREGFDWVYVTGPLALFLIGHSFYAVIKILNVKK